MKKQTNYDRIRNMSVEEMAEEILVAKFSNLLPEPIYCALPLNKFYGNNNEAVKEVVKWLETEVEE